MTKNYPVSRKNDIVVQELDDEVLIYDLKANKAFCLNETSALVWELCDGSKSVSEISKEIGKKLKLPANEDVVWLALDQLKKGKLLENSENFVVNFNDLSRREVIKKIGIASLIALPLVSSIIAPTSAHAASVVIMGATAACPGTGPINDTIAHCMTNADCGHDAGNNGFCCRLPAFSGPGAETCIPTSVAGAQCSC